MQYYNKERAENSWKQLFDICFGDVLEAGINEYNHRPIQPKPAQVDWKVHFNACASFSKERGQQFSAHITSEIQSGVNSLEAMVLKNDLANLIGILGIETQLVAPWDHIRSADQKNPEKTEWVDKMMTCLLSALISREAPQVQEAMLHKLIEHPTPSSGFTPLHFAFFFENIEAIDLLLGLGAVPSTPDFYGATIIDYGRLLGRLPAKKFVPSRSQQFLLWSPSNHVENLTVEQFEAMFGVTHTPWVIANNAYIEELLFHGQSTDCMTDPQLLTYLQAVDRSTGDENLVIAKIDNKVGYGAFAARDFSLGDFIVVYGGELTPYSQIKDHSYTMATLFNSIGLDSSRFRNMGSFINHSKEANAQAIGIFHTGFEAALIIATQSIKKGEQVLIDYSSSYWGDTDIISLDSIPPLPLEK